MCIRDRVGGQDNLLVGLIQGIEGVEEFLLRADLAADKLDIVHQQNVRLPVLVVKGLGLVGFNGVDQLVGKILSLIHI